MEKRTLKWSLILAFGLFGIGVLLGITYFLMPEDLALALWPLYGLSIMMLAFGGFFILASVVLTAIDVIQSKKMETNRKALWLAALLFTFVFGLGVFVAAIYYFVEKR